MKLWLDLHSSTAYRYVTTYVHLDILSSIFLYNYYCNSFFLNLAVNINHSTVKLYFVIKMVYRDTHLQCYISSDHYWYSIMFRCINFLLNVHILTRSHLCFLCFKKNNILEIILVIYLLIIVLIYMHVCLYKYFLHSYF